MFFMQTNGQEIMELLPEVRSENERKMKMGIIIVIGVVTLIDIVGILAALKVASDEDERMGID